MTWDLLGLGAVAVDDLVYVPYYPAPDTKLLVEREERQGGGLTGTALVAAARQGVRTAFMGALGENELSLYTIRELERERVDCAPVLVLPNAGPVHSTIIVVSPTGQRTILHSHAHLQERPPQHVGTQYIAASRALFVDYTAGSGAVRACQAARELGVPTIGDLEGSINPTTIELARLIDHLIINLEFGRRLTHRETPHAILSALDSPGRACTVLTDGEMGGWWQVHGGTTHYYEAFRVPVVDTTGCGDVFHGVYAASLVRGEPLEACIRLASAAAALKASRPGGRSGCPTRAELEQFLASYK